MAKILAKVVSTIILSTWVNENLLLNHCIFVSYQLNDLRPYLTRCVSVGGRDHGRWMPTMVLPPRARWRHRQGAGQGGAPPILNQCLGCKVVPGL